MPNPARQLLETFRRWDQDGKTPQQARKLTSPEGLHEHVQAMVWIAAIRRVVQQIESMGLPRSRYRDAIPEWVTAVLAYPHGWTDNGASKRLFNRFMIGILEGLADEIDLLVPDLNDVQRAQAFTVLDQIADLLGADEDIDDRLRLYIDRLLQHSRDCLENYHALGQFELQEALERLWVALHAAENQSKNPDNKSKWAHFRDVFWPAAAGTAAGGLPQAIAQIALTAGG